MMRKNSRFESFLIRIRKDEDKWIGTVIYIRKGFAYPINKISKIPEIIRQIIKEGDAE